MTSQKAQNTRNPRLRKNPIEAFENKQSSSVRSTDELKKIGSGVFEQIVGQRSYEDFRETYPYKETKRRASKQEFKLFDRREYQEKQETRAKIQELMAQIRQEIEAIIRADSALMSEVNDMQKVSLETLSEKPGEYHIKFLEIILTMLRTIKLKISESGTWLEALKTKKKKRGSLFLVLSKRKGTQYSLSQELQSARSVQ
jgi:hypothetical protein